MGILGFYLKPLSLANEYVEDDLDFLQRVRQYARFVVLNIPLEKCCAMRNRNYRVDDLAGYHRAYDRNLALNLLSRADLKIINMKLRQYPKERLCKKHFFEERRNLKYYLDFLLKGLYSFLEMEKKNLFVFYKAQV